MSNTHSSNISDRIELASRQRANNDSNIPHSRSIRHVLILRIPLAYHP
jgi:hypothetical protein